MAWRSGYLYCPHCNSVYYANQIAFTNDGGPKPKLICPNYFCDPGVSELVTIDELMIEPVTKLNRIGLKTQFCCSGHYNRPDTSRRGYISFSFTNHELTDAPEGWELESSYIIRSKEDDLVKSIDNLNKWVDELVGMYGKGGTYE